MNISVNREEFAKTIGEASHFISNKAQLPVLNNVYLKADKGRLEVRTTNLEMSYANHLGVKVSDPGEITVPARSLLTIVTNAQAETLELSTEGETLKVSGGGFNGSILGVNASDFPEVPAAIAGGVEMEVSVFVEAIPKILFAVSVDDSRPVLMGANLHLSNEMTVTASDGFRLSRIVFEKVKYEGDDNHSALVVPKGVMAEMVKLGIKSGELRIAYDKENSNVLFDLAGRVISSRVIEGQYPAVENIIPKEFATTVILSKDDLTRANKLAATYAQFASNVVEYEIAKDSVKLTSSTSQVGEQETVIPANITGAEVKVRLNHRFLDEFMSVCKSEDLKLLINDNSSPVVCKDGEEASFLHLIMPVKG